MRSFWLILLHPRLAISAIIVLVVTLVLGAIFIVSGHDLHVMIVNMTATLSALMIIIVIIEVLKRKVKING